MKITFHGAAQTVTGSKHLIQLNNGKNILLDCGLFQGLGPKTVEYNNHFGFNPQQVDYVFLSHAHVDHSGLLPRLVKEGFKGKIYATTATIDVCEILLKDSAFIQKQDAHYVNKQRKEQGKELIEPLYTEEDVIKIMELFVPIDYKQSIQVDEDIQVEYFNNGHIIGSATVYLTLTENDKQTRIVFSGDIGRYGDPILPSPDVFPQADYLILESTYGNKVHEKQETYTEELYKHIQQTCLEKNGKLIIPAFSVGRTQELLYALNDLELEKRLPDIEYYVDSPMSTKVTEVVKKHPNYYNRSLQKLLLVDSDPFDFKGLKYISDKRESQSLNFNHNPMVIISASGMAEAGRVKHHIANSIENWRNTILIVGYCEPQSLGAKLKKRPETIKIFGIEHKVKAGIETINSMSAHGDYITISQYLSCQNSQEIKKVFLVHGEPEVQKEFKTKLIKKGFHDVEIPELHETFGMG
jgi:Predicted exonuclease of the beta-lactamase fold involved in RNA processing